MRKLLLILTVATLITCVSCNEERYEESIVPEVEEIPINEQMPEEPVAYYPNMREVIRICIPEDSLFTLPHYQGEIPERVVYQIDKKTVNTYVLTGTDKDGNYVYERVEE